MNHEAVVKGGVLYYVLSTRAGNEKYVAHNPSNPEDYIRCIQCCTKMVRVGNREEAKKKVVVGLIFFPGH